MVKKENGQSMVIVAIMLVLLFGFGALAVDIGAEVAHAHKLEHAAGAAALAGAWALNAGEKPQTVVDQVYTYVEGNGVPSSEISQVSIANGQVKVVLTAPNHFYLAPVIGFRSVLINRSATAATALPAVFDYAIFAGDTSNPSDTGSALYINVNHVNVTGNIHSNSDIYVNANNGSGENNNITGLVEAAGTANVSSNVPASAVFNRGEILSMPDFSSQIETQAEAQSQVYADGWSNETNNTPISGTVWVQGNVTIYTNNVKGAGCVFASGNIDVHANNTNGGDNDMAYYSEGGNITIHTNNFSVNGIFYAPNGTISIVPEHQNTTTTTVSGSLVAKDIDIDSNQLDVDSTSGNNSLMPKIPYLVN